MQSKKIVKKLCTVKHSLQAQSFYFIQKKVHMITTWAVLADGQSTFTPVLERLLEIAQEFVPYFIYIAIGVLGVSLLWKAVKYIMWYLAWRSKWAVRGR